MSQPNQVICPNCQGGNAPSATICQWCGKPLTSQVTPQYSPPPTYQQPAQQVVVKKGRPMWITALLGLIGLCVVIGVIGALTAPKQPVNTVASVRPTNTVAIAAQVEATNTTASEPAPAEPTSPPAEPTATTAPAAPAELTVGSTGESGDLRITLNEVRHESEGFIPAKDGMEYVILNITVENIAQKDATFSSLLSASVKDDTGQKYSNAFGARTAKAPDGAIAVGDKVRGELAYEVPKDAKGLVFLYEPFLSKGTLRFKLDR